MSASKPVSPHIAPSLIGFSALLAAGNWYVQPASVGRWVFARLFLAVLAFVLWSTLRPSSSSPHRRRASGAMSDGVFLAALVMAISLSSKLVYTLVAVDSAAVSQRLTMAIVGMFLVLTGNALPKMLTPLSVLQCDGTRAQALQRFWGRVQVLIGIAFTLAWLMLPINIARPLSLLFIVAGATAIIVQTIRLCGSSGRKIRSLVSRLIGSPKMSPYDLHLQLQDKEVTIIDVNARANWVTAHVPGALNLDPSAFDNDDLPSDKDATLVFYCSNFMCSKAPRAAQRATMMGYQRVYVMSAGIEGWRRASLPMESGDESAH